MTIDGWERKGFGRVELIDHRKSGTRITDLSSARSYQGYGRGIAVMIAVQDDGNTLKVFVSDE